MSGDGVNPDYQLSPEGTVWRPSSDTQKGTPADWPNARRWFPERSVEEWIGLFDRAAHVMPAILGDIFREVRAEEERAAGRTKIGRRAKAVNGSLEELYGMVTPRYSMEPFGESVQELIGTRSLRQFASRVPMHHFTLTRMMRGELPLDRYRLERIAKAAHVNPAFFREWREMFLQDALSALLTAKPGVGIRFHKQMREVLDASV